MGKCRGLFKVMYRGCGVVGLKRGFMEGGGIFSRFGWEGRGVEVV